MCSFVKFIKLVAKTRGLNLINQEHSCKIIYVNYMYHICEVIENPYTNESVHENSNNVVCATSKASDQAVHTRSLIRAFASRLYTEGKKFSNIL